MFTDKNILSVEEICRKLRPIFGKKVDEIYLSYKLADSRETREEIEQMLNVLYRKHLHELLNEDILLEPPKDYEIEGEYPIAAVSYAGKNVAVFGLREQDWIRHVCITGMSGSGKTNLAFQIIYNFIQKNKPFIILDWKKSFRPLMLADPEILCFSIGNEKISNIFKTNVNKPPKGVGAKEWINFITDLITECFSASYGVHKLVSETLDEAFIDAGVYKGSGNYPTWYEIKHRLEDKIKKARGREANWVETALRIAHVLTFGDFAKIINCKGDDATSIGDLLGKKVIFELSALNNIEKSFFCSYLLAYIYKLKKENQESSEEKFSQAILVDEAHNIFLKERPFFIKETVTDTLYREIREYGISLICLDQHISKLSPTILGNSACHIAFQQQLPDDIFCISRITQLQTKEKYFSKLPVGSAIVKLAERYYTPFLVRANLSELKNKPVSDEFVKEKMSYFNKEIRARNDNEFMEGLKQERLDETQKKIAEIVINKIKNGADDNEIAEFFRQLEDYAEENGFKSPRQDIEKVMQFLFKYDAKSNKPKFESVVTPIKERKVYKEDSSAFSKKELSEEEKVFLDFLENRKGNYDTTTVYKLLRLSARKGNKIKNKLLEKNLIMIKEERNDKGRKKIIELA